jgi:hypothetical protein
MTHETVPEVYQFHVWIQQISPMIWRRLLVRSDSSLGDLHDIIQIAFGWSDTHLHRFRIHGRDYGVSRVGGLRVPPRLLCFYALRVSGRFGIPRGPFSRICGLQRTCSARAAKKRPFGTFFARFWTKKIRAFDSHIRTKITGVILVTVSPS